MKIQNLSLVVCFCISPFIIYAQGILAGDTTAAGVVYKDIPNVTISASYPAGYESYSLDVDEDGSADLIFSSQVNSTMGSATEVTRCIGVGENQINCYFENPAWLYSLSLMENIGPSNCWDYECIFQGYADFPDTSYYYGIFEAGYIGFRFVPNNQVSYGWIRAHATSSSITIFDFAYQGTSTGNIDHDQSESLYIRQNPVTDMLLFDISKIKESQYLSYYILDIYGKKVKEGQLDFNNPSVQCQELSPGYYFFFAFEKDFYCEPQMFLKH